jgi:hypothetical protein
VCHAAGAKHSGPSLRTLLTAVPTRIIERTFAWVKSFRRVATRYEVLCHLYDGFVTLACACIALGRL